MRVLNINKFFYMRGGAERYFFALTKLLEDNGHDVIHFSMEDERNFPSKFSKYFVPNLELQSAGLKMLNKAIRPIWYRGAQENINKLIDEYHPDIAHLHLIYHHLSPSILPALKKRGIPVVMTLHDYKMICPNYRLYTDNDVCRRCKGHKYYNAILHRCLKDSFSVSAFAALEMSIHKFMQVYEKHIDVLIAPSQFVRDIFVEFGQDPNKIITLPHFIDPTFLDLSESVKAHQSKKKYTLYFGRLSEEKGVDKILEMMYIYKPDLKLLIAGSGPMEGALQASVKKHKMADRVEFLGHLKAKELISYIKGASSVIVPSQVYETFGFSPLESIAIGTPVVAASIGALPNLIHPEIGKLFPYKDLSAMAKALKEVSSWDKTKVKKAAKKIIERDYLPDTHYQTLQTVYDHLLRNKKSVHD